MSLFSQFNYHDGYIVTNDLDTIHGLIGIKGLRPGNKICFFKENAESQVKQYNPQELVSFEIYDFGLFASKEVTIDEKDEELFLEYLVNGVVDLYYLVYNSNELFFIENDSLIVSLSNEEEIHYVDNRETRRNSDLYKGQLTYLFSDCPEIFGGIQKTSFDARSLANISKEYHDFVCDEYECIVFKKKITSLQSLKVVSGIIFSDLHLKDTEDKIKEMSVQYGIGAIFQSPFLTKNLSFSTGILFSKHNFDGTLSSDFYYGVPYEYDVYLEHLNIKIPILINYTFPFEKLRPRITAGYTNNLIIKPDFNELIRTWYGRSVGIMNPYSELTHYHYGLISGLGIEYQINENVIFDFQAFFEYRRQPANINSLFDFHYVTAEIIDLGIVYKLFR